MAVTTKLTWNEEKSLQKLLGNVSLSLLYKSHVHGGTIQNLLQKCSHQGSTVTIIYSKQNIFGVFMLEHYPKICEDFGEPNLSFCFFFPRKYYTTAMKPFFFNRRPKIVAEELQFFFCYEQAVSLNMNAKKLYIGSSVCKQFGSSTSYDCLECEVFRVEGIKDDPDSIRKINGVSQHRENLLRDLKTYKPITDLVPQIRILLLGPVGSGKSSFFNSVKSVFRGHMTHQAIAGSEVTGITEQYRIYSIGDEYGKSLPFMFCDSMGLGEKEGVGVCMDDILHILKGSVPDRYQFNPHKPITPNHPAFITSPSLKDRIHCVVYVLDVNSIDTISSTMMSKLKRIKEAALNYGIAHVALLTKVNNCHEVLQDNFLNMNRSMTYQSQIMSVSKMLGIPIPNIVAVDNYASERELDHLKDVLILSAVRQMLRAADDFLED